MIGLQGLSTQSLLLRNDNISLSSKILLCILFGELYYKIVLT